MTLNKLCDALKTNTMFAGELNLAKNNLTDLSGLYIADMMKSFKGIRKLNLEDNAMGTKTGESIGDVLVANPDYHIEEISFNGIKLEQYGLRRIIVAATQNLHIKKLDVGIISDFGLELLALELNNFHLTKLCFEEDPENLFSETVRDKFIEAFQEGIENAEDFTIEKIKAKLKTKDKRIEYYGKQRKEQIKEFRKFKKRNKALSQQALVKEFLKGDQRTKKYFRNTFGDLLNDSMYELTRKQEKFPKEDKYFTVEGSCEFVGQFLLDHLPEHEKESLQAEKEKTNEDKEKEKEGASEKSK